MNFSAPFIARPVATTLLTIGIALSGAFAYSKLPVGSLPEVSFPTISVTAQLPGAAPETVATSVAAPLERHLGQIADVTEMTSSSSLGRARITLQFALGRNIDGAARDVQAAINAARADLPSSLRSNPTYRKVNPAEAPVLILSLTSATKTQGQMYDSAATVLEQRLSQVEGVGLVAISGSSLPAVRVELSPGALFKYGIGLEDVRAAISTANAHAPKGAIEFGDLRYQIYTNDQATKADQYRDLVIAYRNGAAVRLSDVADVQDSVEDLRNQGITDGQPCVLVTVTREPGANIIDTVERVKALLPQLAASIPQDIDVQVAQDRTSVIRASLNGTQKTLMISMMLVIFVVFAFLRNPRAAMIPVVAVPVSIVGTFGAMYLLGYSLDNLSLMALTVATGFVVDDAIVVLENITRHVEQGMPRRQAALLGAREIGFTVFSITLSLIAVFLPILLMGGIVGRYFREFALTLSVAITVSLAISLTTTPMMCALFLRVDRVESMGRIGRWSQAAFERLRRGYEDSLTWVLRHGRLVLLVMLATVGLNIWLYIVIPKGFFPPQDTGRLIGGLSGDQSISFQLMSQKLRQFIDIVRSDPAVDSVSGFTGGGSVNSGFVFISLKPIEERKLSSDQVVARLRPKLNEVAGARMFLTTVSDIRVGGRQSNSSYQFTLQADETAELYEWAPKLVDALQTVPEVTDVNSDQQQKGLEIDLSIDRDTARRLGVTQNGINSTLYDAFGQRQVSTIYNPLNQYHVVMEVAPQFRQYPEVLNDLYVSTSAGTASGAQATNALAGNVSAAPARTSRAAPAASANTAAANAAASSAAASDLVRNQRTNSLAAAGRGGASSGAAVSTRKETMVPLAAFSRFGPGTTPLSVNHQGHFVASTISFNLPPGESLGTALQAIHDTMNRIGMPATIRGSSQGTASAFQRSMQDEPMLVLAALVAIYIVLGILYESYIHPITILSTLPSAGVGAVLALLLFHTEFTIISLIGVFLLIGIVKKNAIMMIDVALVAEREGMTPLQSIQHACSLRFRPIMMTTCAAMLGALPLVLEAGAGSELRLPLGITIIGGLLVSQALTLYTTPVIYLYLDRLRRKVPRRRAPGLPRGPILEPGE
jgi:multidrug efflux pump